ncbi:MAG: hypothetical protein ABIG61_07080 [Planctomycetota bacterium]
MCQKNLFVCILLVVFIFSGGSAFADWPSPDLSCDGFVDFEDFAIIAEQWLVTDPPAMSCIPYYPLRTGEVGVVNYQYPYGYAKRYGAGENETAATNATALQNAINYAASIGGGKVVIDENLSYSTTLYLTGKHGVTLEGSTTYTGAKLVYTGSGTAIEFGDGISGGAQRCGLRNIELTTNSASASVGILIHGTPGSQCSNNILQNVRISKFAEKYLQMDDWCWDNDFYHVVFFGHYEDESRHPILLSLNGTGPGGCRVMNFYGCVFQDNRGYAIYAQSAESVNFFGGHIEKCYSTIETASCGAWLDGCSNINFNGMFIEDVGGSIFSITGSSNNISLIGNKFVDVHSNITFRAVSFAGSSQGLVAIGNSFQGGAIDPVSPMYFISSSTRNVNIMGDVFTNIGSSYRYENYSTDSVNILADDGMDIISKKNYKPDNDILGYQSRTFTQSANTTVNAYLIDADGDCMSGIIQVSATSASGEQSAHSYVFNTDNSTASITELGTGKNSSGTISVSIDEANGEKRIRTTTGSDWAANPTVSISVIVTASGNLDMLP